MNSVISKHYDVVIIGSGAGGGTMAYALRHSGRKILLIERGDFLPQEPQNWDAREVFRNLRYVPRERWINAESGKPVRPIENYYVGGKTKVYGAALIRLRREDFSRLRHYEGESPPWPITYEDIEPYYSKAEEIYRVHGTVGEDSSEPPHSRDYSFPPLPPDSYITDLGKRLRRQGITPCPIPIGIDLREGGACIYCRTCDGYPCQVLAKSDAEVCCVRPALASGNVEILTKAYADRLIPGKAKIEAVEVEREGQKFLIHADTFIVSCGAIQSAALLLRSQSKEFPRGIGNENDLVGRHLMFHTHTALVAIHFTRRNHTAFQKLFYINDFYFGDRDWPFPMGMLQMMGSIPLEHVLMPSWLKWPGKMLRKHSIQLFAMSEDLPDPGNRVVLDGARRIHIHYQHNNLTTHKRLVSVAQNVLRRAGFPAILTAFMKFSDQAGGHESGTLRFGTDPRNSVLDPFCRVHSLDNLYVVDASFFPSSGAVNPALTVIAQSLRVADHIAV